MTSRQSILAQVADEQFDLAVIGGGITGACVALDASSRGLKTVLLEKGDFGHATSAASSKLLHGGIRFLQQLRIDKVRESAFERVYFQNLVPHLCHYVPFVIPTFPGLQKGKAFLGAGALAYSVLSTGQNRAAMHPHSRVCAPRIIGRSELDRMIPWLSDSWPATGGLVLPECHMKSSERVTLAIVQAAVEHGCTVGNYIQADAIEQRNGRVVGVRASVDGNEPVAVRARTVANCAGPWLGDVRGRTTSGRDTPITSYFRGAHVVLRNVDLSCALALPTKQKIQGMADRGGRHVFLIPWRGHVLLGTSYAQHSSSIEHVSATMDDARQLTDAVNGALDAQIVSLDNVAYSYAGLYPLTASDVQGDVYQGASDYIVTDHARTSGPRGLFSLFGAKFTTARKLAEVACDRIVGELDGSFGRCTTRRATVPAAAVDDPAAFCQSAARDYAEVATLDTVMHLYENYGKNLLQILDIARAAPDHAQKITADRDNIRAEAVYCARSEMVERLDDFVFRRTGIGTIGHPGAKAIDRCAALIGPELGWDSRRAEREVDAVESRFRAAIPAV